MLRLAAALPVVAHLTSNSRFLILYILSHISVDLVPVNILCANHCPTARKPHLIWFSTKFYTQQSYYCYPCLFACDEKEGKDLIKLTNQIRFLNKGKWF